MGKILIAALFNFTDGCGNIDERATRKYVRFLIEKGIKGFYINGSTGEAFLLPAESRMRVLEIIKEEAADDCFLVVQVGTISTIESIRLAKHASDSGANLISAVTPFYYKFSWEEIYQHYIQIIKSVELPFCPYYIPHLAGVSMERTQLGELLQNPQVEYLKYTASDFYMLQKLKAEYPEITILNGFDEMLLAGMASGADGAIGSTYNFTFHLAEKVIHALKKGDIENARKNQDKINTFVDLLLSVGLWQGMKYLFSKIGIGTGKPMSPFLAVSDENKKIMDDFIMDHPDLE